jgi:hypothetical protein
MWELRHQYLVAQMLASLHEAGIQPVIIKGTALAYSLYPNPVLRTRGDTDLIIPSILRNRTDEALRCLGWQRSLGVSGDHASSQASYTHENTQGAAHALDLHWKISNSSVLSRLFTYEELRQSSQALPSLSPYALGPSPVLSMLIACMHRAIHRTNPYYVDGRPRNTDDRLVWIADIHFLAQKFSPEDWRDFIDLAKDKGLRACAADGMAKAHQCFGSPTAIVAEQLLALPLPREPASSYLAAGKLKQQWLDFLAVGSLSARLQLLREVMFPSAEYMRARFGFASGSLPWLYVRRAVRGATKSIRAAISR